MFLQIESLRKKYDKIILHPKKSGEEALKRHILENELIDCFGSMSNVRAKTVFSTRRQGLLSTGAPTGDDGRNVGDDNVDGDGDGDKPDTTTGEKEKTKRNRNRGKYIYCYGLHKLLYITLQP